MHPNGCHHFKLKSLFTFYIFGLRFKIIIILIITPKSIRIFSQIRLQSFKLVFPVSVSWFIAFPVLVIKTGTSMDCTFNFGHSALAPFVVGFPAPLFFFWEGTEGIEWGGNVDSYFRFSAGRTSASTAKISALEKKLKKHSLTTSHTKKKVKEVANNSVFVTTSYWMMTSRN